MIIYSIDLRGRLATHFLTHTFHHTIFDWLKFIWIPPNYGSHVNFNQSKRVCWKVYIRRCVASISYYFIFKVLLMNVLIYLKGIG